MGTSKKNPGNFFCQKNLRKLKKRIKIVLFGVYLHLGISSSNNNRIKLEKQWLTWMPLKEKNLSLKPFWTEGFGMEKSNMKLLGKDLVLKKILGSPKPI